MANEVYANTREISCKSANGKSICAFPDVCFTPPENPATPPGVPIPYPNTGMATDTTSGSKTVKITGKEIMLKNKSFFKRSTGDEAGCAAKKGVLTSVNMGKVYFTAWSMDVKVEGENVVRHFDLTTHNHASVPGNTPTWPYVDAVAWRDPDHPCIENAQEEYDQCKDYKPYGSKDACDSLMPGKPSGKMASPEASQVSMLAAADDCLNARRCMLQPYSPNRCCPQQTGHHLVEASALHNVGRGTPIPREGKPPTPSIPLKGIKNYNENKAPCVCVEGVNQNTGTHGLMHTFQSAGVGNCPTETLPLSKRGTVTAPTTTYRAAKQNGISAMQKTFPFSKCDPKCIEAQLDAYHKKCNIENDTKIKAVETGQDDVAAAEDAVVDIAQQAYRANAFTGRG
jgi:hypothetical protein